MARSRLAEQTAQAEADRAQAARAQRLADLAERAAREDAEARNYIYPFYPVYRDYSYRNNDRGTRHTIENNYHDRRDASSISHANQNSALASGKSMIGPSKLGWDPSINMMDWDTTSSQSGTFKSSRR